MSTERFIRGRSKAIQGRQREFFRPGDRENPVIRVTVLPDAAIVQSKDEIAIVVNSQFSAPAPELPKLGRNQDNDQKYLALSNREKEVIDLLSSGGSTDNKALAEALSVREGTIKNHVNNLIQKLGVKNRMQAAIYDLRRQYHLQESDENK